MFPSVRSSLLRAVTGAVAAPLLLAGCAALTGGSGTDDDKVVAAFYPLAWVTEQVAGGHVDVSNLTQPGGEPHDLELSIRETADVERAGLVVYEKGFQPSVDAAVDQNAEGDVLDVTDVVDLRPGDPHFWLDPLLMADVADAVADRLSGLDPDHAEEYAANAADTRRELEALDQEYADGLSDCALDTIVVNHDAFGYLARYGLHVEPIIGLTPDAEPTPADLAQLQDLVRDDGITTVFAESLGSRKAADSLAADLGVDVAVLDPIEGLSDRTSDEDYLSLMRQNLARLQEANQCRTP